MVSLEGKSAQAFADDWYDYNGYGMGTGDDGILMVLSIGDRKWAITDYGRATQIMMNSYDDLEAIFRPKLSNGEYYEAFRSFALGCDTVLSGGSLHTFSMDRAIQILPICLLIGLAIGFIVVSAMRRQVKNVGFKRAASDYTRPGSLHIRDGYEHLLHTSVSRTERAKESSSGTHTSSSGRSHGGRSGSF